MKQLLLLLLLVFSGQIFAQKNLDDLLKQYNDNGVPYISVEELAMPKTKAVLLDSREPREYEVSHLKNAICVGYDTFNLEEVTKQLPNKDEKIVVYCSLGIRSETVGEKLKEAGYTNVSNLYGGIFEWKNKEFTIVDFEEKETEKVHAFSKEWSKWLKKGEMVIDEDKTKTDSEKKKKNKNKKENTEE